MAACLVVVASGCSGTSSGGGDPTDVVEDAWAAWGQDADAFRALVADDAVWFGSRLDSPDGREMFEWSLGLASALGVRLTGGRRDSGEIEPVSGGSIVRCDGTLWDERFDAFGTEPQAVSGSYAVLDGRLVAGMAFDLSGPPWRGFVIDWIGRTHPDDLIAACDGADATGESCGRMQLQHVDEAASVWITEDEGN